MRYQVGQRVSRAHDVIDLVVGRSTGVALAESEENGHDLADLGVARVGRLLASGERGEPYRLVDAHGVVVEPAALFLREPEHRGTAVGRPWREIRGALRTSLPTPRQRPFCPLRIG